MKALAMPEGEIELGTDTSITWSALFKVAGILIAIILPLTGWLYSIDGRSKGNEQSIVQMQETLSDMNVQMDRTYQIQSDIRERIKTMETKMDIYYGTQQKGVLNQ